MSWYCPWCLEKRQKYEARLEVIINYLLGKLNVKTKEDFEYFWLMRATIENQAIVGTITSGLLSRAANIEYRLAQLVGERAQFVNYDLNALLDLREDLALLLEDLWPCTQKLY